MRARKPCPFTRKGCVPGARGSLRTGTLQSVIVAAKRLTDLLDLYPCVVEGRAAAEVGERIGAERVGGQTIVGVVRPQALGQARDPGPNVVGDAHAAVHLAELVEHAYAVAVVQAA